MLLPAVAGIIKAGGVVNLRRRWNPEVAAVQNRPRDDVLTFASDPYDLERFVAAQNRGGTYDQVFQELRQGHKVGHWMWFVFPQLAGLGGSETALKYAVSSLEEAKEYLAHPVLGPRLIECAALVATLQGFTAREIFGEVDAQKLRSSMTLFHKAAPSEPSFTQVIDAYFYGLEDEATTRRL